MKRPTIDKKLVARRFARHQETYRSHAAVQAEMARRLAEVLAGRPYGTAFEFGAGDGLLTEQLKQKLELGRLIRNDLVPAGEADFLAGDIEHIELPRDLDLVAANAVWQWLEDPAGLAGRLAAAMKPGGVIAVTGFGPENLAEIAALLPVRLDYRDAEAFADDFRPHFEVLRLEGWTRVLEFPTPRATLEHLKRTGVTGVAAPERWTKGKLAGFETAYKERFGTASGGVSLTYHPLLLVGEKS